MMSYCRQVLLCPLTTVILLAVSNSHFTSADVLTCSTTTIIINFDYESKVLKYPGSGIYPISKTCRWLFKAKASDFIFFLRFETPIGIGSETFNIYDGPDASSTKLFDSIKPTTTSNYKESTTDKLFVEFTSDTTSDPTETGFTLEIGNGKDTSGCSTPSTSRTVTLSSSPYFLTSPSFPSNYPLNTKCTWTFTTSDPSSIIVVRFLYQDFDKLGKCYDTVKVYEGSVVTQAALIGSELCEDIFLSTETRNSTGDSITVELYSDNVVTAKGFSALIYETGAQATSATQTTTTQSTTTTPATSSSTTEVTTTSQTVTTMVTSTSTESPTTTLQSTDSVTATGTSTETPTTSYASSETSTIVTSTKIPTTTIVSTDFPTTSVTSSDSSTSTIISNETPTQTIMTSTNAATTSDKLTSTEEATFSDTTSFIQTTKSSTETSSVTTSTEIPTTREVTTTSDPLITTTLTETSTTGLTTTTEETTTETLSSTEVHTSSTSKAVLMSTQEATTETLSSTELSASSTSEAVLTSTQEATTETLSSIELSTSSTSEAILTTTQRQITNESSLTAESVVVIVASCISFTFLLISMIGVYICFTILNRRKRRKHKNEHRRHLESEHLYIRYFANYSPSWKR